MRFWISVILILLAGQAVALDPQGVADRVVADWRGWMQKHGISAGSIIVAHEGTVMARGEMARSVDDPAKIASLSKAVTAVCAVRAVTQAGKSLRMPVSEAVPEALAAHGPRDARFNEITIGQLMTHTSGLDTDYHRTQLPKLRSFAKENKLWQFSKVAATRLSAAPGRAGYQYANANYLVLGLVIEALSGEGYEPYCQREVLAPLGITSARLAPEWRVMSSWGGWEMSARDYLTFAQASFGGAFDPGRPDGVSVPVADLGRGRTYGAGMLFRRTGLGVTAWHLGSWTGVKGRKSDRFGAYVALYDTGFSVVTNYAHDAYRRDIRNELDSLLYKATHP